jgi:predicted acylesterase/phospholipase RssA
MPRKIDLALSGGGFRATLFHLGVVQFLRDASLLRELRHISSVSGGSILAAHLMLFWHRYCGDDESFADAAAEIVRFARRDVRGRILRRWIFLWLCIAVWLLCLPLLSFWPSGWILATGLWLFAGALLIVCGFTRFTRTKLLQKQYEALYYSATLSALDQNTGQPATQPGSLGQSNKSGFLAKTISKWGRVGSLLACLGCLVLCLWMIAISFWWSLACLLVSLIFIVPFGLVKRSFLVKQKAAELMFHELTFDERKRFGPRPVLHIMATSMTSGKPCSFSGSQFLWSEGDGPFKPVRLENLPVSLAVAASSAFPPFFPPIRLSNREAFLKNEELQRPQYLTDGGVYDNLGVGRLRKLQNNESDPTIEFLLVSDAQALFDWEFKQSYFFIKTRVWRASDILMDRVGKFEFQASGKGVTLLQANLQEEIDTDMRPSASMLQRAIQKTRTDLDDFSPEEISILVRQGFAAGRRAFERQSIPDIPYKDLLGDKWWPVGGLPSLNNTKHYQRALERSQRLKWRLWRPGDWVSWVSTIPIICASVIILFLVHRTSVLITERYEHVFNYPLKPTGIKYKTELIGTPSHDSLLQQSPWLVPSINGLTKQGEEAKAKGDIGGFRVFKISTPSLGTFNASHPVQEFVARLSYSDQEDAKKYSLKVLSVLYAHPTDAGPSYIGVRTRRQDKSFIFTVPAGGPKDSIVIIGRLDIVEGDEMSDSLQSILQLEVIQ